ncbi:MAG: potassium-transporting ATPase subunit KdpC [Steroidobacteraceae bacterium]
MHPTLRAVLVSLTLLTALAGLLYPLAILGLAQEFFPQQAAGSLVKRDSRIVGSTLIGQNFDEARYFWGRPSATAPTPYNAAASSATNLAPSNPQLAKDVAARCRALAEAHGNPAAPIPLDLVTASGSGLDPHVTVAAMLYQVDRVAAARGIAPSAMRALVERHIEFPALGFLGQQRVNVLAVNLALDAYR